VGNPVKAQAVQSPPPCHDALVHTSWRLLFERRTTAGISTRYSLQRGKYEVQSKGTTCRAQDDGEHIYTVGSYIHYGAGPRMSPPRAVDLTPAASRRSKNGDPLYAVYATRLAV